MSHSTIGIDTSQVTAFDKVSGRARYVGDLKLPGMLHAKVLRSPYAHARIVKIDTAAAKALPGVHVVLTGEDTPNRLWGVKRKEHRVLAVGKVRFVGEEVVVVVADDEGTARDALDLVHVEYEELPVLFDPKPQLPPVRRKFTKARGIWLMSSTSCAVTSMPRSLRPRPSTKRFTRRIRSIRATWNPWAHWPGWKAMTG